MAHAGTCKLRFFRNLRYFVKPRGLVKIASNMGAVGVRFSYILGVPDVKVFTYQWTHPAYKPCPGLSLRSHL